MQEIAPRRLPLDSRWNRLASRWARSSDPDLVRRTGQTMMIVLSGSTVGILSALVHLYTHEPARALFTALFALPLSIPLWIIRATGRAELAIHVALGLITTGLVVSPFVADASIPIMLGLVIVPFAAIATAGVVSGLAWTAACTLILAAVALGLPLSSSEQTLAWNTALVCGCLGVVGSWMERSRHASEEQARIERERAEVEARSRADTEASLRDNEALLSTLFRRTPSLLLLADLATVRILEVNDGFVEISGWSRAEAIGKTLTELDAWPSLEDRDQLRKLFADSAMPRSVDLRLRTKHGELVHLLASAELVEVGGRPQLLAQGVDVTRRKRAEEQLALTRRALEERVARSDAELEASLARLRHQERLVTIGTLAAGIAHQINNPIGAISLIAEMSLLEPEQEGKHARAERAARMREILAEARRCGRIVRSVLQFSRNEPTVKWVQDLNPTVRRAAQLARDYVENRGGRLELALHPQPLPILMSPIAVEQIVVNLVRNSAESREAGVNVRIRTDLEGERVVLSVEDDGPGIPKAVSDRIFDPFFTTRLDEGGTGLGLSVAHGIVRDHSGSLLPGNTGRQGTCLKAAFPLQPAPDADGQTVRQAVGQADLDAASHPNSSSDPIEDEAETTARPATQG